MKPVLSRLTDKALVIILAGRNDIDRAQQGLVYAKNARRLKLLSHVKVLFFGPGVELLDPDKEHYPRVELLLKELGGLEVGVSACISNVGKYGLGEKLNRELVLAEEAAFLISDAIKNGYQVISF